MKKIFVKLIFTVILLFSNFIIKASCYPSYNFNYKHLTGLTWIITMDLYFNCDCYTTNPSGGGNYSMHDTCNFQTKQLPWAFRSDTLPNGLPYKSNCYRPNYCPNTMTMCDSQFNPVGLMGWRRTMYIDTVTLPEACGLWKLTRGAGSAANYREPVITNIAPMTHTYYNEAILNADSTNPNSSADWERPMFMYACENQLTQWYLPVNDPDGDSLVYSLIAPRERDVQYPNPLDTLIFDIPYITPLNLNEPLHTNETWRFVPEVPKVVFNGKPNQLALLTFKVEEYRQGVFMGATFRDVLINTIPCTNNIPKRTIELTTLQNVTLSGEDTVEIYAGQTMNLSCYYSSTNSVIKHVSNIPTLLPNSNYTTNYVGGGDSLKTSLQWTPALADTGIYLCVTTVTDTSCTQSNPKIPQDYFHRIIVRDFPQSVGNISKSDGMMVYPNPATNTLKIKIFNHIAGQGEINLYNSIDQLVAQYPPLQSTEGEINIAHLANGIYFVRINGRQVSFTKQ